MHPNHNSNRRRRQVQLTADALESRQLLTGGAGSTFAIVPGEVTTAGQQAAVKVTIDTGHFTLPKNNQIVLGVDVVAEPGSKVKPKVTTVEDSGGKVVPGAFHSTYDRKLSAAQVTPGSSTTAMVAPITLKRGVSGPQSFTVNVSGQNKTTGKFLLGFYLPGDANGDGVVDKTDVKVVKAALNARANTSRYSFDADVNRDGRIDMTDLNYTLKNLGVKTTISPVVSANLDDSNEPSLKTRVTSNPSVTFKGVASPGASIKYEEVDGKTTPVSGQVDSKGSYTLTVPLAAGSNTFRITTLDGFGQSIKGTIAPVTYNTNPAVTPASLATLTSLAGVGTPNTSTTTSGSTDSSTPKTT